MRNKDSQDEVVTTPRQPDPNDGQVDSPKARWRTNRDIPQLKPYHDDNGGVDPNVGRKQRKRRARKMIAAALLAKMWVEMI